MLILEVIPPVSWKVFEICESNPRHDTVRHWFDMHLFFCDLWVLLLELLKRCLDNLFKVQVRDSCERGEVRTVLLDGCGEVLAVCAAGHGKDACVSNKNRHVFTAAISFSSRSLLVAMAATVTGVRLLWHQHEL